jgi:chromate transporter
LKTLTPRQLFFAFSKIGLSGFGGVLPWARRTIVDQERWVSPEEFNAMLGICQIAPGPNIVNLAVCIGSKFGGIYGAFSAVTGLMLGPSIIVILLGMLYTEYSYLPVVQGLLRGISAVGIGLIAGTGFKMMRNELTYRPMLIVVACTTIAAGYFHLGLGWVVLTSSPLALYFGWKKAGKA